MLLMFIISRLLEPSTWRGIIGLATAAGLTISPDQANAIVSIGLAAAGAVGVFTRDAG